MAVEATLHCALLTAFLCRAGTTDTCVAGTRTSPDGSRLATLTSAMQWIEANLVDPNGRFHLSCDGRFAAFGYHMGLSDHWRLSNIWISITRIRTLTCL